jgi:V-type H+-transporting ATPase subunit E
VEISRKIAHSNHVNKSRLKLLAARQQVLADLLSEASTKMQNISKSPGYDDLLKKLILQSVYQLMDPNILIKLRQKDIDIGKKVLGQVISEYTKAFPNQDLKIEIDSDYLPQER